MRSIPTVIVWALGILAGVALVVGGTLAVYTHVQKSACYEWGGVYSGVDPAKDYPAVCWPAPNGETR